MSLYNNSSLNGKNFMLPKKSIFKKSTIIKLSLFISLLTATILFFIKIAPVSKIPEIFVQEASKSGFGRLIVMNVVTPKPQVVEKSEETNLLSQIMQKIKNITYSIGRLPTRIFLSLRPKKKPLYSENAQGYLVTFIKNNLKDDLNKLNNSGELDENSVNNLSQKILSALDESQKQIGQQIKIDNNKVEAKTSIKGEVAVPVSQGSWRIDANPLAEINIYLPEERIKLSKDSMGAVVFIPMQAGSGKIFFSNKVAPLPMTQETISKSSQETNQVLAQYLNKPINLEQKMVLILIFNDQNDNQIFDSAEKLVPWAGLTFYVNKSLI